MIAVDLISSVPSFDIVLPISAFDSIVASLPINVVCISSAI